MFSVFDRGCIKQVFVLCTSYLFLLCFVKTEKCLLEKTRKNETGTWDNQMNNLKICNFEIYNFREISFFKVIRRNILLVSFTDI